MSIRMNMHRTVVTAVHVMILLTMLALLIGVDSPRRVNPFLLAALLLPPLLVIGASIAPIRRKERIVGYWLLAMMMAPLVVLGMFGGWGLLYLIGIIFLLWAAWMENEGKA